jgi:ABC-2 type transport system ATP-binding protein
MNIIETHQLTKYYGKSRGIIDVNLAVQEGEIFGFIGPNGAGKSTTIRTLLNLIYPTSGSATIFGLDIIQDTKDIKRQVGFMPSEVNYYDAMTVAELLRYSANFYSSTCDSRSNACIARIPEFAELFEVDLSKDIADLSTGNKKKVSIIQSLLHRPKLLILDEPTSGLDPLMQARFFDVLRQENERGTTIFFSSHILTEVEKLCKRVAIIKEGKLITIEDIENLRQKHLKRVKVELRQPFTKKDFVIDGVLSFEQKRQTANFLFAGTPNSLLRILSQHDIRNLSIEDPDLEEIFMHYYT